MSVPIHVGVDGDNSLFTTKLNFFLSDMLACQLTLFCHPIYNYHKSSTYAHNIVHVDRQVHACTPCTCTDTMGCTIMYKYNVTCHIRVKAWCCIMQCLALANKLIIILSTIM